MGTSGTLRQRRNIIELQNEYEQGNKKPLETLMRAWKGIKDLPPDNPQSFFVLGGYHGEPFRGGGWGSTFYWGGYCNHGNILFPTWHRVYLVKLEEALRSIPGCEDVSQPFWDETSAETLANGIPWALTREFFELDGVQIPNPLRSFVLPATITDNISTDDPFYTKPAGYETVRYPLSGLVGSPTDVAATNAHNALYPDYDTNVGILNANIVAWLTQTSVTVDGQPVPTGVAAQFKACLDTPNYTLFSNATSAQEWNNGASAADQIVPLENPHGAIHLAVGGFDVPATFDTSATDVSVIPDANGDMGENDTAGLDPIFFFHHCYIDYVFWSWQKKHGATDRLEIIERYPGTNTVDSQGATPGVAPNSWLTLESPLAPFTIAENGFERDYKSNDCINVEEQLGYTYGPGSLDDLAKPAAPAALESVGAAPARKVQVGGIDRGRIGGSFLISAFAKVDGKRLHLGTESVLSRWHVQGCANCQTHLRARATFDLRKFGLEHLTEDDIEIEIRTRRRLPATAAGDAGAQALAQATPPHRVEVR
jgi:tyrosinase